VASFALTGFTAVSLAGNAVADDVDAGVFASSTPGLQLGSNTKPADSNNILQTGFSSILFTRNWSVFTFRT